MLSNVANIVDPACQSALQCFSQMWTSHLMWKVFGFEKVKKKQKEEFQFWFPVHPKGFCYVLLCWWWMCGELVHWVMKLWRICLFQAHVMNLTLLNKNRESDVLLPTGDFIGIIFLRLCYMYCLGLSLSLLTSNALLLTRMVFFQQAWCGSSLSSIPLVTQPVVQQVLQQVLHNS